MYRYALLASAALISASCATHDGRPDTPQPAPPSPMNVTVVKDIVYTPADWPQQLMADIFKPEGAGPFPGVVMIHGGGWKGRTRGDMVRYSKAVAERGYVVMNVSYRFAPQWNFPAQLQDMTQAVLWFRTNAAAHNVQPDRIAAWGYSAGAHLAALVGVTGPGDSQYVEGARVQAIIAGGTPVDLRYYKRGPLTNGLMGVPHDDNPDLWRDASPVALVTSDDPPTFLYHGSLDFTVGSKNAHAMYSALQTARVPAELYMINGFEHFSTFLVDFPIGKGIDFLDRHLRQQPVTTARAGE